jgi:hypothetical protein
MLWNSYISKRGSLNIGRRVEISGALIASLISRVNGGKASFQDFAIHERQEQEQKEGFVKAFSAVVVSREQLHEFRKKRNKK